ncbi:MAG: T9SS type A sorting domain-containing protein, partial [Bacteroidia bacterium]|nr:T9SS type A sorting domain-containing protein [Bacteroidia bacterium]
DSITFYLAVLSTDDNLEMWGDYPYTTVLKIGLDPFVAIEENKLETNSVTVFPNPANEIINIEYGVDKSGLVKIEIYNLTGKKIAQLLSENKTPGNYNKKFTLQDLSSGLYFLKIAVNESSTIKNVFIKK